MREREPDEGQPGRTRDLGGEVARFDHELGELRRILASTAAAALAAFESWSQPGDGSV